MAGKRNIRRTVSPSQKSNDKKYEDRGKDVEDRTSRPEHDRKYRFRDHARLDPDDQRRVDFKQKLLEGVDASQGLEDYRKSDEEV